MVKNLYNIDEKKVFLVFCVLRFIVKTVAGPIFFIPGQNNVLRVGNTAGRTRQPWRTSWPRRPRSRQRRSGR
jgi:hypothetical protein